MLMSHYSLVLTPREVLLSARLSSGLWFEPVGIEWTRIELRTPEILLMTSGSQVYYSQPWTRLHIPQDMQLEHDYAPRGCPRFSSPGRNARATATARRAPRTGWASGCTGGPTRPRIRRTALAPHPPAPRPSSRDSPSASMSIHESSSSYTGPGRRPRHRPRAGPACSAGAAAAGSRSRTRCRLRRRRGGAPPSRRVGTAAAGGRASARRRPLQGAREKNISHF
eukprot:gene4303-biopygen11446